jgi:PAS domain S-box-containing protein
MIPVPATEVERLAALQQFALLDTPPETAFDRLTSLAARLFDVPISTVSLVDENRQWFKSCYGLDIRETPRAVALCAHAILSSEVLVVPDTTLDPRFADNPLVTQENGIRFYAGAPLQTADGHNIGTLCVISLQPRSCSEAEKQTLRDLAAMVVDEIELRQLTRQMQQEITERRRIEAELRELGDEMEKRVQERTAQLTQANKELQLAEERYRGIFENSVEGIFQSTPDGHYLTVNPALARIYAYDSPQELITALTDIGQQLYVDPTRRSAFMRLLETQGVVDNFESQVYCKNGDKIWISESARLIQDDQGKVLWCEGFVEDITLRKQAEAALQQAYNDLEKRVEERTGELTQANIALQVEVAERQQIEAALRQSEEIFRQFAENIRKVFWMHDVENNKPVYISPAYEEIWGRSRDSLYNAPESWQESIHPDDQERVQSTNPAKQQFGQYDEEYRIIHSSGEIRWIRDRAFPIRNERGELYRIVGIAEDITERKRADEAVRQAQAEAIAANRAKSEFLSRMSHELRTPLNGILGFAQVLQMDFSEGMYRDIVDDIYGAGKHLLALINEVLDISRIESGNLSLSVEPVLLRDVAQENLSLIAPLAKARGIHIQNELHICDFHVWADRQRLAQALLNLLSNAVKYNREQGRITLSCHTTGENRLRIVVEDSGCGIAPDKLDRVFTPFDRLGAELSPVEGTGLGLALTKRLIEAMGGDIGIESEAGRGCRFWIELALSLPPTQQLAKQELPGMSPELSTKPATILYVEDNLANFKVIEVVLTYRPQVKLLAAMQGSIGLELAIQHVPDLVLLDLNLPDVEGTEVLKQLRDNPRTCHIPVIVVSADATAGQVARLLESGAHAYLTKPLDVPHFLQILDETLISV